MNASLNPDDDNDATTSRIASESARRAVGVALAAGAAGLAAHGNEVTAEEIRRNVRVDKDRALEAIEKAEEERVSGRRFDFRPDMTGEPNAAAAHRAYHRDQLRGLEAVCRAPFYYRVDTTRTMRGEIEPIQLLLSKARDTGGVVEGDGWMIVSWTAPIANLIQDKGPGETVEFTLRTTTTYKVAESSRYETLLPQLVNAQFSLWTGRAAVASEADLEAMLAKAPLLTELPAKEYTTKPTFGLSDIIVLVDEPQRAAMALPFGKSVVIEGPPGSGKTSIGIMRIAVLYDQQWDALGLKRDRDAPFHDYRTMRVLVYNDEMVEYLRGLAQSIGVEQAQVETTEDFFRRVCRATKLLSGTQRRDRPSLSILKGRREALHAYFAGFRSHVQQDWRSHEQDLRKRLSDLDPAFLVFADRVSRWVARIATAKAVDGRIVGSVGIADDLTDAMEDVRSGRASTRREVLQGGRPAGDRELQRSDPATHERRLKEAQQLVEAAIRAACGRRGITREMFGQPEYAAMLEDLRQEGVPDRTIKDGDRLWRKQYEGELPAYSELDLAMTAWLGAPLLLSANKTRQPWIGSRLEQLTHIVVDEAQDLSPSHMTVLASQLARDGTMTLVGDIHQNLNPHAGLQRWEDARLADAVMSTFGVNHRQTRQLGGFLVGLHAELFHEECPWKPSPRAIGPVPRAGTARSWRELIQAIATEARYWRDAIPGSTGATVAVLYDGRIETKRLRWLQRQLEASLSDQLVPVEVALPRAGGEPLRRTDRVMIASVRQAKGLEFDAVVFVEPRPRWSKVLGEIDVRVRNGLYVAAGRPRAGLSMCMSNLPSCIDALARTGLCDIVNWKQGREGTMTSG